MENNALTRARINRIIAFTDDIQKLSITGAKRGRVPLHRLKKVQSYGLAFTAMKDDDFFEPIAEALLQVIDLCGELRKEMKAGNDSEAIAISNRMTELLRSVEEVAKHAKFGSTAIA